MNRIVVAHIIIILVGVRTPSRIPIVGVVSDGVARSVRLDWVHHRIVRVSVGSHSPVACSSSIRLRRRRDGVVHVAIVHRVRVGEGAVVSRIGHVVPPIASIHEWPVAVEDIPARIVGIDIQIPLASRERDRVVEVVDERIDFILVPVEHVVHVQVALRPVDIHIKLGIDLPEIVVVDLIYCFILICRQVKLIGHLVGEVERIPSCFRRRQSRRRDSHDHHYCKNHELFHNRDVLKGYKCLFFFFSLQRWAFFLVFKRKSP